MAESSDTKPDRYVLPPSPESLGEAPGRGRLKGRRILIVGGGQRVFDAATDPIGNGRAMSIRTRPNDTVVDPRATRPRVTLARRWAAG